MKKGEFLRVKTNEEIAEKVYHMKLDSKEISQVAKPGQFIHIECGKQYGAFLRRPCSLSHIDKSNNEISIIYRVVGKGTKALMELKEGDSIHALGPMGQGFRLENFYKNVAVVAGGMGTAPVLEIIKYYKENTQVHLGFLDQPIMIEEIKEYTKDIAIATEKGTVGKKGLVTENLFQQWSENPPEIIYTCGPKPMMKAIAKIAESLNIPCQVSMEERMGCGVGACLVCSCKTKKKDQKNQYTRVCKDGPVYWGEEIVWDE